MPLISRGTPITIKHAQELVKSVTEEEINRALNNMEDNKPHVVKDSLNFA